MIRYHLFEYECASCGHRFLAPARATHDVHTLRSEGLGTMVIVPMWDNPVLDEAHELFKKLDLIEGESGPRITRAFHDSLSAVCDPDTDGSPFVLGLKPRCPECGSANVPHFQSTDPPQFAEIDVPEATHREWDRLTSDQKQRRIAHAVVGSLSRAESATGQDGDGDEHPMSIHMRRGFDAEEIAAVLLGNNPYFTRDNTFRDQHDRVLALDTLLDWADERGNERRAAEGLVNALEVAVARQDRPSAYDLVWCYFLVTDSRRSALPLDLARVGALLDKIDAGPEPDPQPLDEVRDRVVAELVKRLHHFEVPIRGTTRVPGGSGVLVVEARDPGEPNLLLIDVAGTEVWRSGTSCGDGTIDQVLPVLGELRAIEVTPKGDFQATIDLDTGTLTRIAEWR